MDWFWVWGLFRLLRNVLDGEQARRFDAFSTAVIPKQVMSKVSLPCVEKRSRSGRVLEAALLLWLLGIGLIRAKA